MTAPDSQITITPGATPSAVYNQGTNTWMITLPTGFSGNGLLAAVPVVDTNGAPQGGQGTGPTWSGTVTTPVSGVSINWQWAAAVYPASSGFPTTPAGYNLIGVSPLDGFVGSDHAGTPENYKTHVIGGATDGGGSNYTGSLSGTQTLMCGGGSPPPPATTPLTPGAWFSSPNYEPLTTSLLAQHPQDLGGYVVSTYSQALAIFAAMNCGASTNEGAVGCLAGHLLAAELNVGKRSSGADLCVNGDQPSERLADHCWLHRSDRDLHVDGVAEVDGHQPEQHAQRLRHR